MRGYFRVLGAALVAACFLMLSASGCDEHRLNQGKPHIATSPESVNFRTLNVGEADNQILKVINTGTAPLKIESITIEGDAVFQLETWEGKNFGTVVFPDGIAQPGVQQASSKDLAISFSSSELGVYQAEVVIISDDKDNESLKIPLHGNCAVPNIEVEPSSLDFGGVGLYSSSSLVLTVKNTGESDLLIKADQIELASKDPLSPYLWMASDMQLGSGEQKIMQVLYSPDSVHLDPQTHQPLPDEDSLLIHSNDPDDNPIEVPLSGYVDDNLPPILALRIAETTKLDGTPLADPCAIATSDTARFEATVIDPEGDFLQPSNVSWKVEKRPLGSQRNPIAATDDYAASFKPDMYGEYTVCAKASDPQGNQSSYDAETPCSCDEANAKPADSFDCQCINFFAYPREDIRIELTWENLGPDLDLHLLAPSGNYCEPTRECRFNPNQEDPNWDRFACVDIGAGSVCRTPNCDPLLAGCLAGQECFDDDDSGPNPPACFWRRCSGGDCYWDSRNPDWGVLGDESDDPLLAIDCTHSCRAENINLNHPVAGIYRIMVNYFEYTGNTTATVRVFFKGDVVPSAEFQSLLTEDCDTWQVGLIDWVDPDNHTVTYLNDSHSTLCCQ